MPIIDLHHTKYKWNDNNGNPVWVYECEYNGLHYKDSFLKHTTIFRPRYPYTCKCCSKQRPVGTRCIGTDWHKVCIFCLDEWVINSQKTVNAMMKRVKFVGKELKKNKAEWHKEAMVGALSINTNNGTQ